MFLAILSLVTGLIFLIGGGEFTVKGASSLARRLRIPPYIVGATIVAFGTSAPELAVTLYATLSGAPTLALGNVVGSNIANLALILGLAALLFPINFRRNLLKDELPFVFIVAFGLLFLGWNGLISRFEGIIFLLLMALFTTQVIRSASNERAHTEKSDSTRSISLPKSGLLTLIGLIALYFGGQFLVKGAVYIAEAFHVSQWVIGVIILALGTSMPEVAASIAAAYRGEGEIAIGNVLGSNLFNVLLVLGSGATIHPIQVDQVIHIDLLVATCATFFVIGILYFKQKLGRFAGFLLFSAYIAYIISKVIFNS